jgi:hypothetical protein
MLRLLPYLHAIYSVDRGLREPFQRTTFSTPIGWQEARVDNASTQVDERKFATCLSPGSPASQRASAPLSAALPTLMWHSHTRTHDALLSRYGPAKITSRARWTFGLRDTEIHSGCPQGNNRTPWAANRSTLSDITKLYEGVHRGRSLRTAAARDFFFNNLVRRTSPGAQYTSPYLGPSQTFDNSFLREVVEREATARTGPERQQQVSAFLQRLVLRGTRDTGGLNSNELGYSESQYVEVPFYRNGRLEMRHFVASWFINAVRSPIECRPNPPPRARPCALVWNPEVDALERFRRELFAPMIREALATWPRQALSQRRRLRG